MNRHILAVDDDPDILDLLQLILEQAGYAVQTAVNGRQALARLDDGRPDLVILDIMMPDMSGFSVVRSMRSRPETRDIPVIILTARNTGTDINDAYALGADIFLCKPFDPDELLGFVARFLPHAAPPLACCA